MTKQVGILGGSFDPPHNGHVTMAQRALAEKKLDAVWVIPCWEHPFEKKLLPFEHRFAMCTQAFAGVKRVSVLPLEKELGRISYTGRTLEVLQKRHPKTVWHLVIGEDACQERHLWQHFSEWESSVSWCVFPRGPHSPIPDISAREIRAKIASGQSADSDLPAAVAAYIRQHRLYLVP